MKTLLPRTILSLLCLVLAACTGGDGRRRDFADATGHFVAPAIAGLSYSAHGRQGRSTATGAFRYRDGEILVFRIGALEIGRARGRARLDIADIAGEDAEATLRVARLLLTLDEDEDPSNGIVLATEFEHRFSAPQRLATNTDIPELLASVGIDRSVVDADHARRYLERIAAARSEGPPRFRALADDGTELAAGSGACVEDAETGLMWEVKTAQGPRAASHSYMPTAPAAGSADGSCDPALEKCTAALYTRYVNEQTLCGARDWRLPTERELKTLLDPTQHAADGSRAAIDPVAFPHARPGFYWTDRSRRAQGVAAVGFDDIHRTLASVVLSRRQAGFVRLVRGQRLEDVAPIERHFDPDYIVLDEHGRPVEQAAANGYCVDESRLPDRLRTITLWLAPSSPDAAANRALLVAELTDLIADARLQRSCGAGDWRLPRAEELARVLGAIARPDGSAARHAFPGLAASDRYWTADESGAVRVFDAGQVQRELGPGQGPRALLISTTARPPMPIRPVPTGDEPDAAALAALRAQYARYVADAPRQTHWPAPHIDAAVEAGFVDLGLLPPPPFPADNPYSEAKVALGQRLFFDTRLSRKNSISCASCHDPAHGWTDPRPLSPGHAGQLGTRNAMSIINSAYATSLFWDGRAPSLEAQATGPIVNPDEMHQPLSEAVGKIAAAPEYKPLFAAAFGDPAADPSRIARALATFERTIISRESAFDRFLKGDREALSDTALWGLHLFRTKARCINCHNGPLLSDNRFRSNGLHYYGRELEDAGRAAVTGNPADFGFFRTPSLRDVIHTGGYMHNGAFPLTEGPGVIAMYDNGMVRTPPIGRGKYDPDYPRASPEIRPLGLTVAERKALFAFLQSVSAVPRTEPASQVELGLPAVEP